MDAARDDFLVRPEHSAKLPRVASVDQEQADPVVAVEKVVGRPAVEAHWVAERPEAARLAGATAPQVEARLVGAVPRARSFPQ